jgi:ribosomal protein S18 acetylase RimI-like enzyme
MGRSNYLNQGTEVTALRPMQPQGFEKYAEAAILGYAHDNVTAGRWPAEGALAHSRADFEDSLPQGLATPDNYLFDILGNANGPPVGVLWFAVQVRHGLASAFVYDIEIKPEFRRQGHARRAFEALEPIVSAMGLASIGLHVFAQNPGAQALYAQLGYGVTGSNMTKHLSS